MKWQKKWKYANQSMKNMSLFLINIEKKCKKDWIYLLNTLVLSGIRKLGSLGKLFTQYISGLFNPSLIMCGLFL